MKTAVSIPDEVHYAAKLMARRLGISRSELYAAAIGEYVAGDLTKRLNEIYAGHTSYLDPKVLAAQLRSLPRDKR
ncbi:MAG: hypothetical protein HY049_13795 [Acidobacteria bacterium]|nr:hypothetical protein [Acidobacteriota bacterium]